MPEPDYNLTMAYADSEGYGEDSYNYLKKEYEAHIASLKEYPCHSSCREVWEDGKEVVEGKDYELQWWCNNHDTLNGVDTFIYPYKGNEQHKGCNSCRVIAYPLQQEESEDEHIYHTVTRIVLNNYNDENISYDEGIEKLKKSFTIKRKKP